jgi:hypothetical protein
MPVYSIPNKEWLVRTLKLNALLIAIMCCPSTQAWGDIPHQMNLQGVLVDNQWFVPQKRHGECDIYYL